MTATRFDPDALAALEEERDFLLRSLDDLERERAAGDIAEDDYRELHDGYTARAAAVLRAIDQQETASAAPPSVRPRGRAVVGAVVVAALAVGAGLGVAASSGARRPGDGITGGVPDDVRAGGSGDGAGAQQTLLEAAAKVRDGEALEALKLYDEVLADDPTNPGALTYKGWLLVNVGADAGEDQLVDRGRSLLERSMDAHPDFLDAWFFYGFYLLRIAGEPERAAGAFQHVLANDPLPDMAEPARQALAEIDESVRQ